MAWLPITIRSLSAIAPAARMRCSRSRRFMRCPPSAAPAFAARRLPLDGSGASVEPFTNRPTLARSQRAGKGRARSQPDCPLGVLAQDPNDHLDRLREDPPPLVHPSRHPLVADCPAVQVVSGSGNDALGVRKQPSCNSLVLPGDPVLDLTLGLHHNANLAGHPLAREHTRSSRRRELPITGHPLAREHTLPGKRGHSGFPAEKPRLAWPAGKAECPRFPIDGGAGLGFANCKSN